ncbi:Phospholipid scramblase 3 [Lamellibrachia satsuma]|nr:Phospholipid scramblase 3 [Lamellibrachia satsuma]
MRIVRPFKCGCCGNWSQILPCCSVGVEVQAPVGTTIGHFRKDSSCIAPKFSVSDGQDQVQLHVSGPLCVCESPCCPFSQEFTIYSSDWETQVGKISKQYSGLVKEMFTTADNFTVSFVKDMDVKMKTVLIGGAFLLDFLYFEKKADKGEDHISLFSNLS